MRKFGVIALMVFVLVTLMAAWTAPPVMADTKNIVRAQTTPTSGAKELTGTANTWDSFIIDSIGNTVDDSSPLLLKSGSTVLRRIQLTVDMIGKIIIMQGVYCKPCSYDAGTNTVTGSALLRNQ
jgi:tetrahydromethanopterin S-methyltransferase subunit D